MKARYEVRIDFILFQKQVWKAIPEQWFTAEEQVMLEDACFFGIRAQRLYQAAWAYEMASNTT